MSSLHVPGCVIGFSVNLSFQVSEKYKNIKTIQSFLFSKVSLKKRAFGGVEKEIKETWNSNEKRALAAETTNKKICRLDTLATSVFTPMQLLFRECETLV